jgi:hypothetical protein
MRIKHYILISLLVSFFLPVNAALDEATTDWLNKLDASLAKRSYYEKLRVDRIQKLKDGLAASKAEGKEFDQMYAL